MGRIRTPMGYEPDDDIDISIEIHSPSKGEPGYNGCDMSEYMDEEEYRREQESYYLSHVSMLRRERDWQ